MSSNMTDGGADRFPFMRANIARQRAARASRAQSEAILAWDANLRGECAPQFPTPVPGAMTTFFVGTDDSRSAQRALLCAPLGHGWEITEETIRLVLEPDGPESSLVFVWENTSLGRLSLTEAPGMMTKGDYANVVRVFRSTTEAGGAAVRAMILSLDGVSAAFIAHEEVVHAPTFPEHPHGAGPLFSRLRVRRATGDSPGSSGDPRDDDISLGTVFELIDPDARPFSAPGQVEEPDAADVPGNVVARALIAYHDGSWSSTVGPTIDYICVRRDYYGRGLAAVLFDEIENWFAFTWNVPLKNGKRALKATGISGCTVDRMPAATNGGAGERMSDKDFFFQVVGFSGKKSPTGGVLAMLDGGRPNDEEAVRMYTGPGSPLKLPTSASGSIRGRFPCERCGEMESRGQPVRMCAKCKDVHYCSQRCKSNDAVKHAVYCGQSVEEINASLHI